jgi:hypothetical protein
MIRVLTDRQALFVAQAGLLDIDVDIPDRLDDTHGIMHQSAGVGVRDQTVAPLQFPILHQRQEDQGCAVLWACPRTELT